MMKIMAFNGSPRRNGNTAKLLKEACGEPQLLEPTQNTSTSIP